VNRTFVSPRIVTRKRHSPYLLFLPVGCAGGLDGLGLIGAGGGGGVVTCELGGLCPPLFSYPRCASGWEELFIGALLICL